MQKEFMTLPNDCVLVMKNAHHRHSPQVGQGWQPEVAQFLLDIYPEALDRGIGLSELYQMVAVPQMDGPLQELESLIADCLMDKDDEDL